MKDGAGIPISAPGYIANRITWRTRERGAAIRQWLHHPEAALVGSYFTSNIGDRAMGLVLAHIARDLGIHPGMRSYQLARYPRARWMVMGGGELGDSAHFSLLRDACPTPECLGVHGINPSVDLHRAPSDLIDWLRRAAVLKVRSHRGAGYLSKLLRRDVEYAPDLCFTLVPTLLAREALPAPRKRVLGINLTDFYMTVHRQRELRPDLSMLAHFQRHLPDFAALLPRAGQRYLELMRRLVTIYRQRGWTVVSIPMSEVDALAARAALSGTGATLLRYHPDPGVTMQRIASCERLVASRFHAHVFALSAGVAIHSVAVAAKTATLWSELGLPQDAQLDRLSLVRDADASLQRLLDGSLAHRIPEQERRQLESRAAGAARDTLHHMQQRAGAAAPR